MQRQRQKNAMKTSKFGLEAQAVFSKNPSNNNQEEEKFDPVSQKMVRPSEHATTSKLIDIRH